jgi:hypothetical protein
MGATKNDFIRQRQIDNDDFLDLYCDTNGTTISDADNGL